MCECVSYWTLSTNGTDSMNVTSTFKVFLIFLSTEFLFDFYFYLYTLRWDSKRKRVMHKNIFSVYSSFSFCFCFSFLSISIIISNDMHDPHRWVLGFASFVCCYHSWYNLFYFFFNSLCCVLYVFVSMYFIIFTDGADINIDIVSGYRFWTKWNGTTLSASLIHFK